MCALCTEFEKGKMTIREAIAAGKEIILFDEEEAEHVKELLEKLKLEEKGK